MNKITLLKLVAVFFIINTAFSYKEISVLKAKDIQQRFVKLTETLQIDKYETTNGDYKKFQTYLRSTNQTELYNKSILDTAQWMNITPEFETLKRNYHTYKPYDNHPVVTVSYDAANEYCKWLTNQYNADDERKFKKVIFRLPSEKEWMEAASGGNIEKMYPWGNFYLRNRKGEFLCNFLRLGDQSITYDPQTKSYKVIVEKVNRSIRLVADATFDAHGAGLYNMSGNAAEMVAEKGLAKGGSFNDPGHDVRIQSKKFYTKPSAEIGFRVMMEVIEK